MSKVNKTDEPEEALDEESAPSSSSCSSSSTSSTNTTTTTTTTTNNNDSDTSSCDGSDNDGASDMGLKHRHCRLHKAKLDATKEDSSKNLDEQVIKETQFASTSHKTTTDTLAIEKPNQKSEHEQICKCSSDIAGTSSKLETTVKQESQSFNTQSSSVPNLDEAEKKVETIQDQEKINKLNLNTNVASLGSSYSNLSNTTSNVGPSKSSEPSRLVLRPAPSPSPSLSTIDTNNNKNSSTREGLSNMRRSNFSKSASGSRLMNKSRPNVCDCLTSDCSEKKHSNRRQFIEHYYNSRTQLPTATSTSSFNVNTPLNRLSECDAITRRLLSSPIRTNQIESLSQRVQITEVDKSRRASLGTNTMTDQVFLYNSNPYKSLELGYKKIQENLGVNNQQGTCDSGMAQTSSQNEIKAKQQQQGRSLSVCDEEALNPRLRGNSSNHSSNLNRAISLACESRSAQATHRLLTIIPLFGCDMKSLEQFTKLGLILPPIIDSVVEHILINGVDSIGIFRKSGVKSRILTLRQRIETNQNVRFNELNQNNEFSIYDIADLVKMWFRELKPLPLMTKELIKLITVFLNAAQTTSVVKRDNSSQQESMLFGKNTTNIVVKQVDPSLRNKIESMISSTHEALLAKALQFLAQISSRCDKNQMTSQNLAICLTPSLCATESDQNSILIAQKALEYCIDNYRHLFKRANVG